MSEVGAKHPDLVADEKVRRYILLVIEEARKAERPPVAPVDDPMMDV
jgi:hypothetical protein